MKTYKKIIRLLIIVASITLWSCEDYLEKTPQADLKEEDIFKTFFSFQGYVETMYDFIPNLPLHVSRYGRFNWADDIIPTSVSGFHEGDYQKLVSTNGYSALWDTRAGTLNKYPTSRSQAYWQSGWMGIRAANICLAHLNDLVDATDEQKIIIEGQAYFFRGYFHWEIMKVWGNIPYVDQVFEPTSEMKLPQLGIYVTAEKIIADLQKAADLLPEDWDLTETGKTTLGKNLGRVTKGIALANMAEALLWCGSPLFNGTETGSYTYNKEYCKRAADAAYRVIQLGEDKGLYALQPWDKYKDIFVSLVSNRYPVTKEYLFSSPFRASMANVIPSFCFSHILGKDAIYDSPTANYIEQFEMASGLPIDDPESGYNPNDPWKNRDPRFGYNILIDGERQVVNLTDDRAFVQLYIGGRERKAKCSVTGYGWKKYWHVTFNSWDKGSAISLYWDVPRIRFSEMYLFYAEAANEAYGPTGKAPGANLTAIDAINKIRTRAGMPGVNAKFTGSTDALRGRIWNERAVELAFENERWYDLRRWHVAHLPKYTELYELQFDKAHTYFKKNLVRTIVFNERHYFMPFPINQVSMYPEFKQNPGWQQYLV